MLYLDEQHKTHDQVVKELGIQDEVPQNKDEYILALHSSKWTYREDGDGNPKAVGSTHSYKPKYTFRDKQGNVRELVYAERKPFTDSNGDVNYGIRQLQLNQNRRIKRTFTPQDYEIFLWFFLNPRCLDSPFAQKNKGEYQLEDRNQLAQEEINKTDKLVEALEAIQNMDEQKQRRVAKGIGVSNVKGLYPTEVDSKLRQLAESAPEQFVHKLNHASTTYKGLIYDAADQGILKQETINGVKKWMWSDGTELDVIPKGADPYNVLESSVLEDDSNIQKIKDDLKGKDLETKLETANISEADDFLETISDLWDWEAIEFDKAKSAWYWLDSEGNQTQEIAKVGNRMKKRLELAQFLTNEENKKEAQKFKSKHTSVKKKVETTE